MYYPIRRMRRKQNRVCAKLRLRERYLKFARKEAKGILRKDHKPTRHVQFTGKLKVCSFDKEAWKGV